MFEHHEVDHDHSIESETNESAAPETGAASTPQDGFSDHDGGMTHEPERHEGDQAHMESTDVGLDDQPIREESSVFTGDTTEQEPFDVDTEAGAGDAETNTVGNGKSAEVLDLIAGVEDQLEKMRNAQTACVEEIDSIENRRQQIITRETELAEFAREFEQKNTEFEARTTELDDRERHLVE